MDEFEELLKEAYERGCPACGATGDQLYATRQAVHETVCRIDPDGSVVELRTGRIHGGVVVEMRCLVCGTGIYVNGEWL